MCIILISFSMTGICDRDSLISFLLLYCQKSISKFVKICKWNIVWKNITNSCISTEYDPYFEIDLGSQPVAGITRKARNAHSSGTPGSHFFARSYLLYWVFTGLMLTFYPCGLFSGLLHRLSILDLSAGTLIIIYTFDQYVFHAKTIIESL